MRFSCSSVGGAISTGSHNAAITFGGMHDAVRGIHLVLPGRTVFVQRESDPVVTRQYLSEIGADRLISDDNLFNAMFLQVLQIFGVNISFPAVKLFQEFLL